MKATELMIGDWVLIDEPDKYAGATGQIQSLMYHREGDAAYFNVFIQGKFGYVSRDVCSDDIRPITLTAEILEKNGFKKDKYGQMILDEELGTSEIYIVLQEGDECYWWTVNNELIAKTRYVHELQHIFRLCKIEKTIEL